MEVLFQVKLALCKMDVAALPIHIWFTDNVVVLILPRDIAKVPDAAFKLVHAEPEPSKLVADNVLDVLFQVKFTLCKMDVAALLINTWLADNVVVPMQHREKK